MRIPLAWWRALLIFLTIVAGWSIGRRFNNLILVSGSSMAPSFHAGQLLRFSRAVPADIRRGAVVIVLSPGQPRFIKRVIGLPNETVSFNRGEVFINGRMLYEPYVVQSMMTFSWDRPSLNTGPQEYVLLGDHRLTSEDSRHCGAIPRSQIIGIVDRESGIPELLEEPHYRITLRKDANDLHSVVGSQHAVKNYDSL